MEQDKKSFVHDTINLDEIRNLIEDNHEPEDRQEPEAKPESPIPEKTPKQEKPKECNRAALEAEEEQPEKESKNFVGDLYNMLHDLVYILSLVTLLFAFVVRLNGVDGESMLPTLHNGDYLLLQSNFLYKPEDIQNGDIVVINEPYYWNREHSLIVKRVIATEGQTIDFDFDKHEVYVDQVLLQEDYINTPTNALWSGEYAMKYPATVPEGHIFVLGDNRDNSSDSRFAPVGMIDARCVLGKVWAIVMPGQSRDIMGNITDSREWGRIGLVS